VTRESAVSGPRAFWWRFVARFALLLVSATVAYRWATAQPPRDPETRFELLPVSTDAVAPDWNTLPTVAVVDSSEQAWTGFALGPFALLRFEISTYPDAAPALYDVRLCDSSNVNDSGVLLWPSSFATRQFEIPRGTWKLRLDAARDQWLVSYSSRVSDHGNGADERETTNAEVLTCAVVRRALPVAIRRSLNATWCALGAGLIAIGASAWHTRKTPPPRSSTKLDCLLTVVISSLVLLTIAVLAFEQGPNLAVAWDLRSVGGASAITDWSSWQLMDLDRGPFSWRATWNSEQERVAHLGPFIVRSTVLAGHAGLESEANARVCLEDSCISLDPPVCPPRTAHGPDPRGCPVVYGLRYDWGTDTWGITYADREQETTIGAAWTRVRHVELSDRLSWLPWASVGIAVCSLLLVSVGRPRR
jgi:hypothetical protein